MDVSMTIWTILSTILHPLPEVLVILVTGICVAIQGAMSYATIGATTALILIVGIIAIGCIFYFKRVASKRDRQADESILTQRSRQLKTGDNYTVHQYVDIDDYDEVSQRQWQLQGRAEEGAYDEVFQLHGQQQGPTEEEDYDEVSQTHDQQHGPAEEGDNSDPALPALADNFPEPHDSEYDDGIPVLPVLAEYFPGAQATEESNGGDTLPESVSGSQSYTPLMRDVFVDDARTVVTYISPTEDNT
ncbi:uncharacterized protein LOC124272673 [Haliotis rubra]|uniref:uncharacterized protein LOC124272673 n=1 Tax=Haliotis rubra TaxID=36100 RepID=UPI001EE585A5|nr:uncharacterized protein LOC124272673 [Haliotis rubra]